MSYAENTSHADVSPECPPPGISLAEDSGQIITQDIIKDIDYLLCPPGASPSQHFTFYYEGIQFEAYRKEQEHGPLVQIQAVLGFLPYSAQSSERRSALLQILQEARQLINVRFGLDHAGKILVVGRYADETIIAPDFIFFPFMKFIQEARPFISLIGRYL